jgi:hypothetical protein
MHTRRKDGPRYEEMTAFTDVLPGQRGSVAWNGLFVMAGMTINRCPGDRVAVPICLPTVRTGPMTGIDCRTHGGHPDIAEGTEPLARLRRSRALSAGPGCLSRAGS